MSVESYPRIELDYLLRDEALYYTVEFLGAAKDYAASHDQAEKVSFEMNFEPDLIHVKIGKQMLRTMTMASLLEEADRMTDDLTRLRGHDTQFMFNKAYVGSRFINVSAETE